MTARNNGAEDDKDVLHDADEPSDEIDGVSELAN